MIVAEVGFTNGEDGESWARMVRRASDGEGGLEGEDAPPPKPKANPHTPPPSPGLANLVTTRTAESLTQGPTPPPLSKQP